MIGMSLPTFAMLLLYGLIGSFVLQFLIRYRTLAGADGFFSKWIAGWVGAWLGAPVFGYWGFHLAGTYLVPGLLGAFAVPFLVTAMFKASTRAASAIPQTFASGAQPQAASQFEMRKAS